jgi:hypothetical protein
MIRTRQIDVNDPQIRNVLVPAIQQLKRMGIGQVVPQQPQTAQAVPPQPQAPATAQVARTHSRTKARSAPRLRSLPAARSRPGTDPEIQKQIATYTAIASNPAFPKSVQEAAITRLKALQEQGASDRADEGI